MRRGGQVLAALQRLVNVLGPECPACYPLLLPILRYCTDISQARRAPARHALQAAKQCTRSWTEHSPKRLCLSHSAARRRPSAVKACWRTFSKSNAHSARAQHIKVCARPCAAAQPEELNLLEDGLQLWLVALRNAPAPEPGLLHLFPHLVAVMERSTGAYVCEGGLYAKRFRRPADAAV